MASEIVGIVEKLSDFVSKQVGGISVKSDKGTFPKAAQIDVTNAPFKNDPPPFSFVFLSPSAFGEDDSAVITLLGNFGFNTVNDTMEVDQPILGNVMFDLNTSTKTGFGEHGSLLTFEAKLLDTVVGTKGTPRLRFLINATFDPVGPGSCTVNSTIEVDNNGFAEVVGRTGLTAGAATIEDEIGLTKVTIE
jgi:hypothetical protein